MAADGSLLCVSSEGKGITALNKLSIGFSSLLTPSGNDASAVQRLSSGVSGWFLNNVPLGKNGSTVRKVSAGVVYKYSTSRYRLDVFN